MASSHFYKLFQNIQNKHSAKTVFLPLLALLPLIFGGLAVSGGIARGVSAAVSAAKSKKVSDTNFTEIEWHNREIDLEFKKGKGVLSNLAFKIPVFGAVLK